MRPIYRRAFIVTVENRNVLMKCWKICSSVPTKWNYLHENRGTDGIVGEMKYLIWKKKVMAERQVEQVYEQLY